MCVFSEQDQDGDGDDDGKCPRYFSLTLCCYDISVAAGDAAGMEPGAGKKSSSQHWFARRLMSIDNDCECVCKGCNRRKKVFPRSSIRCWKKGGKTFFPAAERNFIFFFVFYIPCLTLLLHVYHDEDSLFISYPLLRLAIRMQLGYYLSRDRIMRILLFLTPSFARRRRIFWASFRSMKRNSTIFEPASSTKTFLSEGEGKKNKMTTKSGFAYYCKMHS